VTIYGSGFTNASSVNFGGSLATPTVISDSQITVTAPAHAAGTVYVQVTTPLGTSSAVVAGQFTYTPGSSGSVVVTYVTPASGVAGTSVTIYGSGFSGATSVSFGGSLATPTVVNDSQITVTAPAHSAGTVDITVTTPFGTSAIVVADQFTYTSGSSSSVVVTYVTPASGIAGTSVTVYGTGFTGATYVSFGGATATPTVINDSQITVIAPAHAAGTVDITVTTPFGTSAIVVADQFTYTASSGPYITSISPTSGPAGTTVTIYGSGFTGATSVSFGGLYATYTVNSDTQITATAPSTQTVGLVNVVVTTSLGSSTQTVQFSYTAATPTVTGVSPTSGPRSGGTSVTITGTNFTGATSVTFGGLSATFTVNSSTRITATSPAMSTAGLVNILVTTPSGTSTANTNSRFTYLAPQPVITSITPASGPAIGYTPVVILGSGFTGATSVSFGGSLASFNVDSDNQISAITSGHATGTVTVTVTTSSGTSAVNAASVFTYTVNYCPSIPLWVNDLDYGVPGGGFWWDPGSQLVWTSPTLGWSAFNPNPPRPNPQPLWVNAVTYGSIGGGFYWDPVSGQVWTAERGWHPYSPQNCVAQ
jgi:hypothetical protein